MTVTPKQLSAENFQGLIEDYPEAEALFPWLSQLQRDTRGSIDGIPRFGVCEVDVQVPPGDSGSCVALYTSGLNQTFTTGTVTVVNFETKDVDSDNAVRPGSAWKFTVPSGRGGDYLVNSLNTFSTTGVGSFLVFLYKNGAVHSLIGRGQPTTTASLGVGGGRLVRLVAGDYIDIRLQQNTGSDKSTNNSAGYNWVSINRMVPPLADVTVTASVKKPIEGTVKGVLVAKAVKVNATDKVPAPRISWDEDGDLIRLRTVADLPPNGKYRLTLLVIGA